MLRKFVLSALAIAFTASTASATTTIVDGYHGAEANNPFWADQDIIGLPEHWDVSHMDVTFNELEGTIVVDIFSTFFDNVGRRSVELGDLFISVDGWNPFGTGPYNEDDASNGEDWELVAVLDDHGEGQNSDSEGSSYLGESGVLQLYNVIQSNIEYSFLAGDYRVNQETQYDAAQQQAIAEGSWSILDVVGSDYDQLQLVLNVGPELLAKLGNLGFHWTMTCGNDVIEGSAEVPEPSTLALIGMGLLGLPRAKRKSSKQ